MTPSRKVPRPRGTPWKTAGIWALVAAVLAVGLVAYGAWVRSSGSGLGCPDWPLCNGKIIPENTAAAIESGHRWYAAITSIAIFVSAFLGFRLRRTFPKAAALLGVSAVLVVLQALLGAAVVLTELHPLVRLVHLGLAMTLIAVLTVGGIALVRNQEPDLRLRRPGWHLLPLVIVVVLLGGSIVATATSFECAALPLCDESSSTIGTALHSLHRTLGVVLFAAAAVLALRQVRKGASGGFVKASVIAAVLLLGQMGIGTSVVAAHLPMGLRVLHLGMAAAIWMALVAAWSLRSPSLAPTPTLTRSTSRARPRPRTSSVPRATSKPRRGRRA